MGTNPFHLPRLVVFLPMLLLSSSLSILLAGSMVQPLGAAPDVGQVVAGKGADPQSTGSSPYPPETRCVPDWNLWPGPNYGLDHHQLMGVAALSTRDVWIVGTYLGWPYRPIIEHWDGASLSAAHSPDLDEAGVLRAVSAVSSNDVWAVGYYDGGNRRWRTLVEHWNGTAWSQVPSPNAGTGSNYLFAVKAISSNDVWVVGSSC